VMDPITISLPRLPLTTITKSGSTYTIMLDGVKDMASRAPTEAEYALGIPRRYETSNVAARMSGPGAVQLSNLTLIGTAKAYFTITIPAGNATVSLYSTAAWGTLLATGALAGNGGGAITLADPTGGPVSGRVTIQAVAVQSIDEGNIMWASSTFRVLKSGTWPLEVQGTDARVVVANAITIFDRIVGENMRKSQGRIMTLIEILMLAWRKRQLAEHCLMALANAGELVAVGTLRG